MRWRRWALIVPGAAACIAGALLVYVDLRYELIRAAPRVEHESFVTNFPSVRILVDPSRAGGRFESFAERKRMSLDEAEKWLSPNLGYDPSEADAA